MKNQINYISIIGLLIAFTSIASASISTVTIYYKAIPNKLEPKPDEKLVKKAVLKGKDLYLTKVITQLDLVNGGVEEIEQYKWGIWDYKPDLRIYCKIDCTSSYFWPSNLLNMALKLIVE